MQVNDPSISLKHAPLDFFYLNAGADMPNSFEGCVTLDVMHPDLKCNDNSNKSLADWKICYKRELCKNKDLVSWIHEHQNKHSEHIVKTTDIQSQYVYEIVNMINLCVGTGVLIFYIYYNK
jgi:hypothetical protein